MVMSYDNHGREVETAICHGTPEPPSLRIEQDENGDTYAFEESEISLGRSGQCGEDSFLAGKVVFAYDESGNMIEIAVYAAGSSIPQGRFVMTYDGKEVSETTVYKADGSLESKERFERELDANGNWVKETVSSWVPSVGESELGELEPTEIHHRTITYY